MSTAHEIDIVIRIRLEVQPVVAGAPLAPVANAVQPPALTGPAGEASENGAPATPPPAAAKPMRPTRPSPETGEGGCPICGKALRSDNGKGLCSKHSGPYSSWCKANRKHLNKASLAEWLHAKRKAA